MRAKLRKIGNSRGIIVPAAVLAACELGDEVEIQIKGNTLVIKPARKLREGWFKNYRPENDPDVWDGLPVDDSKGDWTW